MGDRLGTAGAVGFTFLFNFLLVVLQGMIITCLEVPNGWGGKWLLLGMIWNNNMENVYREVGVAPQKFWLSLGMIWNNMENVYREVGVVPQKILHPASRRQPLL